jgi:hypothetical protein
MDTIKKNAKILIDASKEVGLDINEAKTKYLSSPQCRSKSGYKNSKGIILKCITV